MKFEVGKEYVSERGDLRIRAVAANNWGVAFEHLKGAPAGTYGCCAHAGHGWRPAPRVVERWIVLHTTGTSYIYDDETAARDHAASYCGGHVTVNGPFPCEAP